MKKEDMKALELGDKVMCLDAVELYDTKFPHKVAEINKTHIVCRATAIRKNDKGDVTTFNPDTTMFYGFEHDAHNLEHFTEEA